MFGDNLKKARKHKGLTQKELSDMLGISCNGVSNWENGVSRPDIDQVRILCSLLGVSADDLITPDVIQSTTTFEEKELIKKYNFLDIYGKKAVDALIDVEFERCNNLQTIKIAARNGTLEERTITDDEKKKLLDEINQMPDVPE